MEVWRAIKMLPESNLTDLVNLINKVKTYKLYDEANTKSNIITPILQALRWNVNSSFEVIREYPLEGGGRVDYALRVVDDIKVLIEAKKMNDNLSNYENQIRKYATDNKHINLFIISNGMHWQFFTWFKKGIALFKFIELDIINYDAKYIAKEFNMLLSKDNIASNMSYNYMRDIIAKDQFKVALYNAIIEVWHNILEEPSPLLCNLIIDSVKNTFGISAKAKDVEKILNDYNIEFKKIRGTVHIKSIIKGHKLEAKTYKDLKRLIKNIESLRNLRKTEWMNKSEFKTRTSQWFNIKTLEHYLNLLEQRGIIEIDGEKIKLIGEFKDYYD